MVATQDGGVSATAQYANTIVANNASGNIGAGGTGAVVTSLGHNISDDGSGNLTGPGDQPNTKPLLAPLGNYGGPTPTMALLPGSPAIDKGSASIPGVTVPTTDQRGALRGPAGLNAGSTVDVGAYEASSSYLVTTTTDSVDVGTLRTAVGWANVSTNANPANSSNPAPNSIIFDTAGAFATPQTITLSPSLGTLELSNTATAEVIDGPGASLVTVSVPVDGVRVFSVDSGVTTTLTGLTISGVSDDVYVASSGTATITGNSISSHSDGILVDSSGTATITGNSISCGNNDIEVAGAATIGGATTGAGNTLSFTDNGVVVDSSGVATITGNSISGTGNTNVGIFVISLGTAVITSNSVSGGNIGIYDSGAATIGGTASGTGNTISANVVDGIFATSATILGNSISGNGYAGIEVDGNATIGGTSIGAGNTISGNGYGIFVDSSSSAAITGNSISGNYDGIEVDSSGSAAILGNSVSDNGGAGILDFSAATIGGTSAGAGNTISGNADGIFVQSGGAATITGDSINGNNTGILVGYNPSDHCIVTAQDDDLSDNTTAGVTNEQTNPTYAVTATYDWWGSGTGPANPNNPGGTGSAVSANVIYSPWLTYIAQPVFSALAGPMITYGTPSVTLSGTVLAGSTAPPGSVSITVGGLTQSAAIQANGDFSSMFNTAGLGVAGSPYTITYTYAATGPFLAATDTTHVLTVIPANQTITWSNPADIVYGTPLGAAQLNATVAGVPGGSAPGALTYSPPAGTILGGGAGQTLTVNAAATTNYNPATATVLINVDRAGTTTSVTTSNPALVSGQSVTFTAEVSPSVAGPGIAAPTGTVDFLDGTTVLGSGTLRGGVATYITTSLPVGSDSITASYVGDTNFNVSSSSSVAETVNPDSTTTGLAASVNPSAYGQAVTFTAMVAVLSPGAGTPTGTVTFKDGATTLGSGTLAVVNGQDQASFTTTALSVSGSPHSITAVYGGDTNDQTSTSNALSQTVNQDSTTSSLAASVNPSAYGQAVTFTAMVAVLSPEASTPTGTVTFKDGTTTLGTGTLAVVNGQDQATFTTSSLSVAMHSITAVYAGDTNDAGSTSNTVTQTVNQDSTTTGLAASVNPSVFGQAVTFTAIVAVLSPGAGTPIGTVTFKDGATTLGTGTLAVVNGQDQASFTTTALSVSGSPHSITAVYGGDTNDQGSTSSTLTQTVNQDSTTTTLSSSANPSVFGQAVTFTATVSANSPGAGTPIGTVTFMDGATTLGTGTLAVVNGQDQASFTTAALSVSGSPHSISAVYSGDTNDAGSTSNTVTQTVNQDSTTTGLAASVNPSVFGQAVTFTAIVAVLSPGAGTPTGTVTFKDGATTLGTGTLAVVNGQDQAGFSTAALSVSGDPHTITAVYGGDPNDQASTSNTLTFTVNFPTPTLTAITPDRIAAGSPGPLILTVTGSGFAPQSVIGWNRTALTTSYVSTTELTATIPASGFSSPGTASITVTNPTPGGGTSASLTFQVFAPPTSVYVNAAYAGDAPGTAVTWTDGSTHYVGTDAFATIQGGVNAVAPRGTVYVAAGTYPEQVTISEDLTLVGAGSATTVLQPPPA
jgi:parallel beta-helix repeat protein